VRTQYAVATVALLMVFKAPAAAPDDPWFHPPGGTWLPDSAIVSDMKVALDVVLPVALAAKTDVALRPMRYWFQYQGRGSGADKVIELIGHPFPVSADATRTYFDVGIPENCVVSAHYDPIIKQIRDLSVGGLVCPPRI
jgi:hypothetical protein